MTVATSPHYPNVAEKKREMDVRADTGETESNANQTLEVQQNDGDRWAKLRRIEVSDGSLLQPQETIAAVDKMLGTGLVETGAFRARCLSQRGIAHLTLGNLDSALADLRAGLELARVEAITEIEATCQHHLGVVLWHRAEHVEAMNAMYAALALRRALNDEVGVGKTLSNLGALHGSQGNYSAAIEPLLESLAIARRRGTRRELVPALANLGMLRIHCEELDDALPLLEEAVEIARENDDPHMLGNFLAIYADALRKAKRLDAAKAVFHETIRLRRRHNNLHLAALGFRGLGMVFLSMGKPLRARRPLLVALSLTDGSGSERHRAGAWHETGRLYVALREPERARECLEKARALAEQYQERELLADVRLDLSNLFAQQNDMETALRYFREYHETREGLQKQKASHLLQTQIAKAALEKARHDAELERLRNVELAELNQQNSQLITQLQQQTQQLARLAMLDSLTGLYNRRFANENLPAFIEQARAERRPLSLAIADLDNFKRINDRLTHAVGDIVLRRTADVLRQETRPDDVLVRYGGEEFLLLFCDTPHAEAVRICETVRRSFAESDWASLHPDLHASVSIGVVEVTHSGKAETVAEILDRADRQMYRAKQSGKNCVVA